MNVREELQRLCALEAHIKALTSQKEALRRSLLNSALDEFERVGAAPTWRVKGAGSVALVAPEPSPTVVDEAVLVDWARERFGDDAVEVVYRPRKEWVEIFFERCAHVKSTCALVSEDGEVVPGVVLQERTPYLRVVLSSEAKMAALDALAASDWAPAVAEEPF